jgi:hypothetical protein
MIVKAFVSFFGRKEGETNNMAALGGEKERRCSTVGTHDGWSAHAAGEREDCFGRNPMATKSLPPKGEP